MHATPPPIDWDAWFDPDCDSPAEPEPDDDSDELNAEYEGTTMAVKTHKTFAGVVRAVEREIAALQDDPIEDDREYRRHDRITDALLAELDAIWTNPADVVESRRLRNRLLDAWDEATL